MSLPLDKRPIIVAIAGPNGAGKTTFFQEHLRQSGLRFVNADMLSRELNADPYLAAKAAEALRRELLVQRESFVFETVFSDPAGDKLGFLLEAVNAGYTVLLCFIGIAGPDVSEQRVAFRVSRGGHDVPSDKLASRYPRTLSNLRNAVHRLPYVFVFDNGDPRTPFVKVAVFEQGKVTYRTKQWPKWLKDLKL